MMRGLKAALLASTFLTFAPAQAEAAPVALTFALSLGGTALAGAIAGTAFVWSTALATAAVAAVGAGLQMRAMQAPGPGSREITLNKVQPVTEGLILYGERMLGGSITARSVTSAGGKTNGRYHAVIPLACHEIEGVQEVWLGEERVWTAARYATDQGGAGDAWTWGQIDSDYKGKFRLRIYTGTEAQEADARYRAAADEWTTAHRGRGIAYIYFEADFDPDIYPMGPEEIRARVRGKKVFDPRDGVTRFSANPALCLRDYVLTPEVRGGVGWREADIDEAAIIALANVSDELVPLAGGGTEARYAFNGVLDTALAPSGNLDRLATSWGGWWANDRGRLSVGGGAFEIPSFELDFDMVSGPIRVTARRPFEQQFNQVKALYADPAQQFTATDLPVLKSATFKAEDNGEDLVRDLGELPGEISFARGQRLQKLALLKGRRQKRVEIPCNLAAWGVRIGDVIEVTIPRRGWDRKQFEIERRVVVISPSKVEVRLSMLETSAAIYDWNTSEETAKPAGGISTLPSRLERPDVDAPSVAEALYSTRTGGIKTRVTLTTASANPFVSEWQFRFIDADDRETVLPSGPDPEAVLDDFKPGIYRFAARGRTKLGLTSDWAEAIIEVAGLALPPASIGGISAALVSGMATLRWTQHPDLDVRQGGQIEVRHSSDPLATWQTSTTIGKAVPGSATTVTLPAISGIYLLRATDSTGNAGPVSTIITTAPNFQQLTTLATVTESPTFAGAKSGCAVAAGNLALDEGQVSALYTFAGAMNFGQLRTVRVTTILAVLIGDRSDLFDSTELFDSAALFEGAGDAEGDVQIYYRASPSASAPFGDWVEFDRTDVSAWRLEFRAELVAASVNFSTQITTLGVVAEGL